MTNQADENKKSENQQNKENNECCHSEHNSCKHEESHGHQHHADEHNSCGHDHHTHDHNCGHDHGTEPHEKYHRFSYTETEMAEFSKKSLNDLIESVNHLLENEIYGKAVPLLEEVANRLSNANSENEIINLNETKHHLALSYGIIGEHKKSLPLWKEVISWLEKNNDPNETLEAYYNAALTAEQAQQENEFSSLLNKALELSKYNQFEDWEATFEHELGIYLINKNDLTTAEKKLNHAIEIRTKNNDYEGLVSSQYYLATLFESQKNTQKAVELYENALELSKNEEIREYVEHERSLIEKRLSAIKNSKLQEKLLNF